MLASGEQILKAARDAGIKVPAANWNREGGLKSLRDEFPHFFTYYTVQFGKPMHTFTEYMDNAKVIAGIELTELLNMDLDALIKAGFRY